jgi:hypothetical protein
VAIPTSHFSWSDVLHQCHTSGYLRTTFLPDELAATSDARRVTTTGSVRNRKVNRDYHGRSVVVEGSTLTRDTRAGNLMLVVCIMRHHLLCC